MPPATLVEDEEDSYQTFLAAAASDVNYPDGDRSGHWAGHSKPVVKPPESLVREFSTRTAHLLVSHEENESFESSHWAKRLAAFDEREELTPHRSEVKKLLKDHEEARRSSFVVLERALEEAEKSRMQPEQLEEELETFEAEVDEGDGEADEGVAVFEAECRSLQARAPSVAHLQFDKVSGRIEDEIDRRAELDAGDGPPGGRPARDTRSAALLLACVRSTAASQRRATGGEAGRRRRPLGLSRLEPLPTARLHPLAQLLSWFCRAGELSPEAMRSLRRRSWDRPSALLEHPAPSGRLVALLRLGLPRLALPAPPGGPGGPCPTAPKLRPCRFARPGAQRGGACWAARAWAGCSRASARRARSTRES